MHGEPRVASPMISQQVAGHRLEVTDEAGDWVRARGADQYDGWMHVGFLSRLDGSTGEIASHGREASLRVSLGCITCSADGQRRALPLRSFLAPDETVMSGEVIEAAQVADRFPSHPIAVTRSAQGFFAGTSYLWGGVTPWGADCSGLVQSVFALHGRQLPRDAWQQAELGADAGRDVGELQAGDLLFFSDRDDRRVTHVGLSLGERRMVHLSLGRGGYAIERLDDRRDPYVERLRTGFIVARRMIISAE